MNGYPPNFAPSEFYCKCGKCLAVPPNAAVTRHLAWALQQIRNEAGVAINITSGYRCPDHNKAVGGVSNSQHVKGTAADLQSLGIKPAALHAVIEKLVARGVIPPGGLGLYNTFVHYDIRASKARWEG